MRWKLEFAACSVMAAFGVSLAQAAETAAPKSIWDQERTTLTGDWGGSRNELAKKGITLDIYLTQIYQGAVTGDLDNGWQYGGRENIALNFDMGRMGLMPGGLLSLLTRRGKPKADRGADHAP